MERKPNLFIIGAMKSGTTSLHDYLSSHPSIYMSRLKEPMHFSREENYLKGNEQYLKLFDSVVEEAYFGESSTEYTKLPRRQGVASRIHNLNPDAKLIYVMRDPFDRIVSQFKHMVKTNRTTNTLLEEIKSGRDYLTTSYYSYQLKPYIELFGRDAIFVGLFEDMIDDSVGFCRRIFSWLGVDDVVLNDMQAVKNSSPREYKSYDRSKGFGRFFNLIDDKPFLKKHVPSALINPLKNVLLDQVKYNFKSDAFKADVERARYLLTPMLVSWVKELRQLTGVSFDRWPVVQGHAEVSAEDLPEVREIQSLVEAAIGRPIELQVDASI